MNSTLTPLEDVCISINSGGTPSRQQAAYWDDGTIPWIKTGELNDWKVQSTGEKITEEGLKNSSAKIYATGTVLIAMYGDGKTMTTMGLVDKPSATNQACCALVADALVCDPLYLFYALKERRSGLLNLVVAGAQRNLSVGTIRKFPILMHPLETQRRIIGILGAYDSLIDVNRRRIRVLEEIARGLFTDWFIRLRFPGYEDVAIEETPDGPLPTNWSWERIGEVAAYVNRGIPPKYDDEVETMVIGQKCIRDQRLTLALARKQSKNVPPDKIVRSGDVLINSTGTGTLGRVAQAEEVPPGLTVDSHVTIVRPLLAEDRDYLGLSLFNMQSVFERLGAGSTNQTELARSAVQSQMLLWAPINLRARFGRIVRPMRSLIEQLAQQNESLATARDLLLPRLISGQLSVTRAERNLEAV